MTTGSSPGRCSGVQMATEELSDTNRTVMRNTIVVTTESWLSKLLYLGFNVVVVRWLGEVGLGEYATVIAFVGLFGILFNFGMSQHMERSIARDPDQAAVLFWNLVALRLLLAAGGVALITGVAVIVGYDRRLVAGICLYTISYVLSAVLIPLTGVLRANARFDVVTSAMLLSRLVSISVGLGLLWLDAGFFALLLASFVAMPVQIWLLSRAVQSLGINLAGRSVDRSLWPSMIRTGLPFGFLALGLSFNANVITVVLGQFSSSASVGWYSAAYRLVFHVVGIMGGFLVAMTPSLTRMHAREPDRVVRWTSSTFNWLAFLVLPVSAGLSLLAPDIIHLLYGSSYSPAGPVLRLLAWDIALMLGVAFFANVCAAVGLERGAARIYLAGMLTNVAVSIAVIAAFGRSGAAAVNLVIDGASLVVFAVMLSRSGWLRLESSRLARVVIATTVMGAVVWVCRPLPLMIVIAVGAMTFGMMALVLGLVEWRMVVTAVRRRFGFSPGASY